MQQTSVSWWLTVTLLRQILFSFPGLANLVYFFKGDCLQVLGFRNNLLHVLTGGKDYTHWWNKLYVCVYPGCITLLPRSLHVKSCRDRVIISSGFQEKGGCPLIRACSVITSNTVMCNHQIQLLHLIYLLLLLHKYGIFLKNIICSIHASRCNMTLHVDITHNATTGKQWNEPVIITEHEHLSNNTSEGSAILVWGHQVVQDGTIDFAGSTAEPERHVTHSF